MENSGNSPAKGRDSSAEKTLSPEKTLSLFAASLACGPDTPALARWLLDAAPISAEQRARQEQFSRHTTTRAQLATLQRQGWQLVAITDTRYPRALRQISDPPGLLYCRGNTDLLNQPQLAIVGARHGTPAGCRQASNLARELASQGFVISSGLALGVDGAAHQGALETGHTIAVLAHGPDRVYPSRHRGLAEQMVADGSLLVTEFAPGQAPLPALFPQRNRVISGMSQATLVVEAEIRSGSLVTARLAAEQGREVFAMPGAVHNRFARGCHQLLRDGAEWLESAADVTAIIDAPRADTGESTEQTTSERRHPLLEALGDDTLGLEHLAAQLQLAPAELARQLCALEMAGDVERVAGGYRRTFA